MIDAMSLPKTAMITFEGVPLRYWTFIRAFECSVGNKQVDDAAKLN
jgi:hypothetical protein